MKKIIILANTSWNIHNFRRNILQMLLDAPFEVVVVTPIDAFLSFIQDFPNARHIPLKKLARKSINPLRDLQLANELIGIFRAEKPNIILNYTIKPNIIGGGVAQFFKIPYICVVTGLGYTFLHNGFLYWLTKILYELSFQKAEKVIFENIDDRLLFNQLGICSPQKSISVKGCGINIHHFTPQPPRSKLDNTTIFTFIGRFLYDKGLLEFVAAARLVKKQHPKTIFWLVGEIDTSNLAAITPMELQSWKKEGVVIDQGFANDVRPFIAASDCVVLPSYREAIPRVLQESMAMERTVITTNVAGCRETVDDKVNGFLVPVKTVQPLAAAMIQFIELPEAKRKEMGKNARKKVEREFDERLIAADFLRIITHSEYNIPLKCLEKEQTA